MPGFKDFFALNQNNQTTISYGTPMGTDTDGDLASSYYFKPFYFLRGVDGVGATPFIARIPVGQVNFFEVIYSLSLGTSTLFAKQTIGFNDLGDTVTRDPIEYLYQAGSTPSIFITNDGSIIKNIGISLFSNTINIFGYLVRPNVQIQGIYQYI